MKISVRIAFFICMYLLLSAQVVSSQIKSNAQALKALDEYFREIADDLQLHFGNKVYSYKEFPNIRELAISEILKDTIPERTLKDIGKGFPVSAEYNSFIQYLKNLKQTNSTYIQNKKHIEDRIGSLNNLIEKNLAMSEVSLHFPINEDTTLRKSFTNNYFKFLVDALLGAAKDQRGDYYEWAGDAGQLRDLALGYQYYSLAYDYFDSVNNTSRLAKIESKIGNLFTTREGQAYHNRALIHHQKASDLYQRLNDTPSNIFSDMNSALAILGKADITTDDPSWYDALNNVGEHFGDTPPDDYSELLSFLAINPQQTIDEDNKVTALSLLYTSLNNPQFYNLEMRDYYLFFTALGCYFTNLKGRENVEIGTRFFNACLLIAAYENDYERVQNALINLTWPYGYLKNRKEMDYCIEKSIELAARRKDKKRYVHAKINKANALNILGEYSQGLKAAHDALAVVDTLWPDKASINSEEAFAYRALKNLHENSKKTDSADFYNNAYFKLRSESLGELEKINLIEAQLNERINNRKLEKINYLLGVKEHELVSISKTLQMKQAEVFDLESTVSLNGKRIANQDSMLSEQLSSMSKMDDSIRKSKIIVQSLQGEAVSLNQEIQRNFWIFVLGVIGLGVAGLAGYAFIKRTNKRYNADVRALMNDKAKVNVHNVSNSFNKIAALDSIDSKSVQDYAQGWGIFYRKVYENWDITEKKWTLEKELNLVDQYFKLANEPRRDIEIIPRIKGVVIEKAAFVSEVLFSLLQNSMEHAFVGGIRPWKFIINIAATNGVLFFTIEDNGIGDNKDYLKKEGEHALKNIKSRIEIIAKYNPLTRRTKPYFKIEVVPGLSTTIKFILPYETID